MTLRQQIQDAARYRFLRSLKSRDSKDYTKRALTVGVCDWAKKLDSTSCSNFWSSMPIAGAQMDKYVDVAMRLAGTKRRDRVGPKVKLKRRSARRTVA